MKKLMIYYFVAGLGDTYKSISYEAARANDQIFKYNGNYYFRRHISDNSLEPMASGFNSREDPLFKMILENRRTYMIWEEI